MPTSPPPPKGWLPPGLGYGSLLSAKPLSVLSSCPPPRRSKAEMRHTCRGTINLATANITVEDSCNFIISNGGAQTYHLKASSEVERQRWVTALELAKAKAVKMLEESGMALPPACHHSVCPRIPPEPGRTCQPPATPHVGPSPSTQGLFCRSVESDPTCFSPSLAAFPCPSLILGRGAALCFGVTQLSF